MTSKKDAGSLSEKFEVVAVYEFDENDTVRHAGYLDVLQALREGERDRFFMRDMLEALVPSYKVDAAREPLSLVTGTHKSGLRMSIVQASHEGVTAFLPIVEDSETGRLLVVGPQAVGGALGWNDVTYVSAGLHNRPRAVEEINDFMADAFRHRGLTGSLDSDTARDLVENLVKAALIIAQPRHMQGGGNIIPVGTTLGECFAAVAGGEADVNAFVVACHKFDAEKSHGAAMSRVYGDAKVEKQPGLKKP